MSKLVLVTGGSQGIGYSICERLIKEGFKVDICSLDCKELPIGYNSWYEVDLSDVHSITKFISVYRANLSTKIYSIVNNAGVCFQQNIGKRYNFDQARKVLEINLIAPCRIVSELLDELSTGGRIVNISSQLGHEGRRGYGDYCASKFGLRGYTKCWAKELGSRKITVNSISPGWVKTSMSSTDISNLKLSEKDITDTLELRRMTEPSEIASLVNFLLSPDSSGISGRDFLLQGIWNQL